MERQDHQESLKLPVLIEGVDLKKPLLKLLILYSCSDGVDFAMSRSSCTVSPLEEARV
jgi:hypothetical protein